MRFLILERNYKINKNFKNLMQNSGNSYFEIFFVDDRKILIFREVLAHKSVMLFGYYFINNKYEFFNKKNIEKLKILITTKYRFEHFYSTKKPYFSALNHSCNDLGVCNMIYLSTYIKVDYKKIDIAKNSIIKSLISLNEDFLQFKKLV